MTVLLSLILVPLLSGIIAFLLKGGGARVWALISSLLTLMAAGIVAVGEPSTWTMPWIPALGAQISLEADSMSTMLCLLTAIIMPVLLVANWNKDVDRAYAFYGLLLLAQAGLMGVFLAHDALLFYFFWELALIPVYFLCSQWGGEKRVPVTFKFFIYTFVGSLMLLAAIIYLSLQSQGATNSFAWETIVRSGSNLPEAQQQFVFWLIFIAFAIKMPIFPFHTWQPDTYEQSPTPVTIVLSALMVKMGMYGVLRWLLPVVPAGVVFWSDTVVILSIAGIVYASLLALVQTDLKRLVAYSSVAHMGLMCAAAFASSDTGIHGILVQMFNHGINITGMWLIVGMIESRWGTRDMTRLGGMAVTAPRMTIALLVIAFANIALPLTNGFIGEFMLFNGIFRSGNEYHITYMVIAGLGMILGALYTLNMVQRVAYGDKTAQVAQRDLAVYEYIGLAVIIGLILFLGVYPNPLLEATSGFIK
jgi:NADH-quinone oxidoreductase subunit M